MKRLGLISLIIIFLTSCTQITNNYQVRIQDFTPHPETAQIAQAILESPAVTNKHVEIYIANTKTANAFRAYAQGNKIYLSPRLLSSYENKYLDVIIAHELGHIELNTRNQDLANFFAALVISKTKVVEYLYFIRDNKIANSKDSEINEMIAYLEKFESQEDITREYLKMKLGF